MSGIMATHLLPDMCHGVHDKRFEFCIGIAALVRRVVGQGQVRESESKIPQVADGRTVSAEERLLSIA